MSRTKHTEAQMIGALKQLEAGRTAEDVAREVGVSKHTIYAWKAKYGGTDVSQAQEAKLLRDENTRLHALLQGEERVNHKRVERVYRELGLTLRRKKRKHCVRVGRPLVERTAANQEWGLDFVHDVVQCGRTIRVLSIVDAYTRECLALEVDTSFASRRVTRVLEEIIAERGVPQAIRCDNGPELTSRQFLAGAIERKIELLHIQLGKPTQNARWKASTASCEKSA